MLAFFSIAQGIFIILGAIFIAFITIIFSAIKNWYQSNREEKFWWD